MSVSMTDSPAVFRFAPSPNGALHLGHAYSAIVNFELARENGGRFLLRMEDIDTERCSPALERGIYEDLEWLGLEWDGRCGGNRSISRNTAPRSIRWRTRGWSTGPISAGRKSAAWSRRRKTRWVRGRAIRTARRSIPAAGEEAGDEARPICCGSTWRGRSNGSARRSVWEEGGARAVRRDRRIAADPAAWGDVVLARRDTPTSYNLSVVVDDALQGVTHVVRGRDLFHATSVHVLLQELLGFARPHYFHHDLVLADDGRKLSKSNRDTSLQSLARGRRDATRHPISGSQE
jgi:glutamyl-Q tRNA(Asp) synthetase